MTYRILTNNSLVYEQLKSNSHNYDVLLVPGLAENVFQLTEEALQSGWQLLTSPLPPNVPLIRSPIRTIILKAASNRYDSHGLQCLAKAWERTTTLAKAHPINQRDDLEHIDWTFTKRAMLELGLAFH